MCDIASKSTTAPIFIIIKAYSFSAMIWLNDVYFSSFSTTMEVCDTMNKIISNFGYRVLNVQHQKM